jgi:hypothetical protein
VEPHASCRPQHAETPRTHTIRINAPPRLHEAIDPLDLEAPPKKQKTKKQGRRTSVTTEASTDTTILSGAVAMLDDSRVFRPAAHAKSDVSFIDKNNTAGYELHTFLLKLRSPVFSSMLAMNNANPDEPIMLAERADELKMFFHALYSNSPQMLLKDGATTCSLARLSHKYAAHELELLCDSHLKRLARRAKFTCTKPSVGDILLVAQETQNDSLTKGILALPMTKLCAWTAAPQPAAPMTCVIHAQRLPCYYQSASCTQLPAVEVGPTLSPTAMAVLTKLSPKTLVALIQQLMLCVATPRTTAARRAPLY